jgi:peptidoglycan/xylan/chitin deacetylase (PgdA/CDA1 family)
MNIFSGIATIFMLHRVAPFEEGRLIPNENMKISPEFLENFIVTLKKSGYTFISLDELYDILNKQKKVKKCIIFTLDDGYKDNYEIAYPLFKSYNVPFTIYIATSFPNKNALLWWYALEDLIIENKYIEIEGNIYECKNFEEKNKTFMEIRQKILNLNQKDLLNELNTLFKNYYIDWYKYNEILCLNWNQIIELSKDNLCTIGGHTVNHLAFNTLDKEEILKEILEANKELESKIGKKIDHFAYPFGSHNEVRKEQMEIVSKLNFKTVVTTRMGNIFLEHREFSNCCLPRIMLVEKFDIKNIKKVQNRRVITI